eukprot:4707322-Pyramimonas_sp.AAC.1
MGTPPAVILAQNSAGRAWAMNARPALSGTILVREPEGLKDERQFQHGQAGTAGFGLGKFQVFLAAL